MCPLCGSSKQTRKSEWEELGEGPAGRGRAEEPRRPGAWRASKANKLGHRNTQSTNLDQENFIGPIAGSDHASRGSVWDCRGHPGLVPVPRPPWGRKNCKAKPRSFPQKWLNLHTLQVKQATNRHKIAKNLMKKHDSVPDQNGSRFRVKNAV